jgi:hypothetical protein
VTANICPVGSHVGTAPGASVCGTSRIVDDLGGIAKIRGRGPFNAGIDLGATYELAYRFGYALG